MSLEEEWRVSGRGKDFYLVCFFEEEVRESRPEIWSAACFASASVASGFMFCFNIAYSATGLQYPERFLSWPLQELRCFLHA